MSMKVLYICSNKISTFSENSNAYQQPFNLCKNSTCTILTEHTDFINPNIKALAYNTIQAKYSKLNLFIKIILNQSIDLDLKNFDCIVSDFSESSLCLAQILQKKILKPWHVIIWDPPFGNRYEIKKSLISRLENKIRIKFYNYLISKSSQCFSFINNGVFKNEQIHFPRLIQMVNGVDLDITSRILQSTPNDIKVKNSICVIGRIRADKGSHNVLEAFRTIGQELPNAQLIFIGQIDGTKTEQLQTKQQIESHPHKDRIKVTNRIPFVEAMTIVATCEIGLHAYSPSRYLYWNHVLKIGEYQALGAVPIAVRYPGTEDIITNMKNGVLIDSNSSTDISRNVLKLLKNPENVRKIRMEAQEMVKERSWKLVTKRMFDQISMFTHEES